jgi:hypothetical protein
MPASLILSFIGLSLIYFIYLFDIYLVLWPAPGLPRAPSGLVQGATPSAQAEAEQACLAPTAERVSVHGLCPPQPA